MSQQPNPNKYEFVEGVIFEFDNDAAQIYTLEKIEEAPIGADLFSELAPATKIFTPNRYVLRFTLDPKPVTLEGTITVRVFLLPEDLESAKRWNDLVLGFYDEDVKNWTTFGIKNGLVLTADLSIKPWIGYGEVIFNSQNAIPDTVIGWGP